jgi:hypothetical protein
MVKGLCAAALAGALLLGACSEGMYDILSRTTADPYTIQPLALSFKESNAVIVSWPADPAADEYILQRAADGTRVAYQDVYRGTGTEYRDGDLPDQAMYLYRLAKRRGDREFPPSDPVLAVSSLVTRDAYEENGGMQAATHLGDTPVIANMYYYRSYSGLSAQDVDWYWFDIPPGWRVSLVVTDARVNPGISSHFRYYIAGRAEGMVVSDVPIPIDNYEKTALRCYFRLFPDVGQYIMDMPPSQVGGGIVAYEIKIVQKLLL